MERNSHDAYLNTQVYTATPQKLHLMLIEGAIRFARQTIQYWEEEDHEQACESLIRCRRIITEILAGIKGEDSEVARRTSALYVYLFQTLTEAQLHWRRENLDDVIRVLEIERETWTLVCEQMPEAPQGGQTSSESEITAGDAPPIAPIDPSTSPPGADSTPTQAVRQLAEGGFSLEA